MGDDDVLEVIEQAERVVQAASWRLQEEIALGQLAGRRGLALARLEPRSDAIQLVAYDDEHLGHVRREGSRGPDERWVAVLKAQARQVGSYGSAAAAAAAAALALACGKMTGETG